MGLLQQPEYVHILLNHLPLTGSAVALMGLGIGMMAKNRSCILIGLGLVGLMSASAWPVAVFGEKGYDRVYSMAESEGRVALDRHAELAQRWLKLHYATAALAWIGLALGWKWPKTIWLTAGLVIVFSSCSIIQSIRIAEIGGQIRHREFRP